MTGLGSGLKATISTVSSIGTGVLCSTVRGVSVPAELQSAGDKESKRVKDLRERTEKNLKDTWDTAKTLIPPDAESLVVNFSQIYVGYTYRDNNGNEVVRRLGEAELTPALIELMKEVRIASKTLWLKMNHGAEFGSAANRSLIGNRPFEMVTEKWATLHPRSLGQFIQSDFSTMYDYLKDDPATDSNEKGEEAFRRIVAAEAYKQTFRQAVAHCKMQRKQILEDPTFPIQYPNEGDRKKLKQSLADLESLEALLQERVPQAIGDSPGLDSYPIRWEVGVWGDTDPETLDEKGRYQMADQVSTGIQLALTHKLKPGDVDRGKIHSFLQAAGQLIGFNDVEGDGRRGLGPFVKNYSLDAGDLAIHSRLELIGRLDAEGREMKGVSMEEFISHNINYLGKPFDAGVVLDSLGFQFDQAMRGMLEQGIQQARTAAQEALDAVRALPIPAGSSAAERIQILQRNDKLRPLLGEVK
jgi:hypothetical protein